MGRTGKIERKTKETEISVVLDIDGRGQSEIDSGMALCDHMLVIVTRHGLFDVKSRPSGILRSIFITPWNTWASYWSRLSKKPSGTIMLFVASARQAARWTRPWPKSWLT